MISDESSLGLLAHKVRDLDPGSRALLDLSVRRGLADGEIAGVLGTDPAYVSSQRAELMHNIAADLSLDESEQAELQQALASLPVEAWLPKVEPRPTNGHSDGESEAASTEDSSQEAEVLDANGAAPTVEHDQPTVEHDQPTVEHDQPTVVGEVPADEDVAAEAGEGDADPDATAVHETPADEDVVAEPVADADAETPADEDVVAEPVADADAETPADEDVAAEPAADADAEKPADGEPAAAAAADEPKRSRGPIVAGGVLLIGGAALAAALAIGSGDADDDAPAPPPAQQPAEPAPQAQGSRPRLEPLPGIDGVSGTARLRRGRILLNVRGLPRPRGRHEVWLYDSVIDSRSIGTLKRDGNRFRGRFRARNAGNFRFVDVTVEPRDGNRNHSGRSVLRIRTSDLR